MPELEQVWPALKAIIAAKDDAIDTLSKRPFLSEAGVAALNEMAQVVASAQAPAAQPATGETLPVVPV